MTSKRTEAGNRRVTPLPRVLALVLLALVTHTATVEIVHQHGDLLPANATISTALHGADKDDSTTDNSRSTGECLICQLHQNLFSTLLFNIPDLAPPAVAEAPACKTLISSISESNAPRRGRAPPSHPLL